MLTRAAFKGARIGPHTVRIIVSSEIVRNPPKIAPEFNTQSKLRYEVKPGSNENVDFDVKTMEK